MNKIAILFGILANFLVSSSAFAVEKSAVDISLIARKITITEKGEEKYIPANEAKPGDVIQYKATYTNNSNNPVSDLKATLPIPVGAEVLPSSFSPQNPQASLDGKRFEAIPLKRIVTLPNGKKETQLIPFSDYRFLRWNIGQLPAGKMANVSSRIRITQLVNN